MKAVAKAPVIGTIKLLLVKVEGPGNDSWVKPGEASDPRRSNKKSNGGNTNAH